MLVSETSIKFALKQPLPTGIFSRNSSKKVNYKLFTNSICIPLLYFFAPLILVDEFTSCIAALLGANVERTDLSRHGAERSWVYSMMVCFALDGLDGLA